MDKDIIWHPSLAVCLEKQCRSPPQSFISTPYTTTVHIGDSVYFGGPDTRLYIYSLSVDTWNMLDTQVKEFSLASYGKSQVAVVGGWVCANKSYNQSSWVGTNQVWILSDKYELNGTQIPKMRRARVFAHSLGYKQNLIVVGGDYPTDTLKTVEIYDGDTKEWSFVSLRLPPGEIRSSVFNDDIWYFLMRGESCQIFFVSVPSLVTSELVECSLVKLPETPRAVSNCLLYQKHLIIIGSKNYCNSKVFFTYSASSKCWLEVANVPTDSLSIGFDSQNAYHLVPTSSDKFLLIGKCVEFQVKMFLASFYVQETNLKGSFLERDLKKLEYGARIPVLVKLDEHLFELEVKLDYHCENASDSTEYVRGWIQSKESEVSKRPTWENLLWLLRELKEEETAEKVEKYLTTQTSQPADDSNLEAEGLATLEEIKKQQCKVSDVSIDEMKKLYAKQYQELKDEQKTLIEDIKAAKKRLSELDPYRFA